MKKVILVFILCIFGIYLNFSVELREKRVFKAITDNNIKLLKRLIDDDKSLINIRNNIKQTPLLYSIYVEHEEIALYLIESGADINLTDIKGVAPIDLAVKYNLTRAKELLIKKGAKINLENIGNIKKIASYDEIRIESGKNLSENLINEKDSIMIIEAPVFYGNTIVEFTNEIKDIDEADLKILKEWSDAHSINIKEQGIIKPLLDPVNCKKILTKEDDNDYRLILNVNLLDKAVGQKEIVYLYLGGYLSGSIYVITEIK
ncbi:MAG: ankyrin repeat domain-containing protein [Spirochaetes bacterium]|nr:ankyrin repeat domain-containing protein [Spirochaetota bacterium]